MKIVFMGTPEFAVFALSNLLSSKHQVVAVYTQPPRPASRGMKLQYSPIHLLAEKHNIPIKIPINFKSSETIEELKDFKADIAVVSAYGLLLPKSVLTAFPMGCINIHPSLLPKFRGAAPIHRTVLSGDTETALCIMQMDEGLDTGDILLQEQIILSKQITSVQLHDQLGALGAKLLIKYLDNPKQFFPQKQSTEGASYAKKIIKEEGKINWQKQSAQEIERLIRGLSPKPGVYFSYKDEIIKILSADFELTTHNFIPGEIVNLTPLSIACKQGILFPKTLQRQGKNPLPVGEFIKGIRDLKIGEIA